METKVYDIYCAFTHKLLGTYFNENTLRNLDKSRCYCKVRIVGGTSVIDFSESLTKPKRYVDTGNRKSKLTGLKPKFESSVSENLVGLGYLDSGYSSSNKSSDSSNSSGSGNYSISSSYSSSDSSCGSSSSDSSSCF